MRILLVDIQGQLPNLALMKLSAYFKEAGHEVFLNECPNPDKVFVSSIYSWDKTMVDKIRLMYPGAEIGGTGVSLEKRLPEEIDAMKPDYSLYTYEFVYTRIQRGIRKKETTVQKAKTIVDAGLGRTAEGCFRSCSWCVVPRKEGALRQVATISELLNPRSNVLILLDANLTADPHCLDKLKEIKDRRLIVDLTQGIDVRLMTDEIAKALSAVSHLRSIHYAWDECSSERSVFEGIRVLKERIPVKKHMCFMLCGFRSSWEEDLYRFRRLVEEKITPYVMIFNKRRDDIRLRHFARFVNSHIHKCCDFESYAPWVRDRQIYFTSEHLFEEFAA